MEYFTGQRLVAMNITYAREFQNSLTSGNDMRRSVSDQELVELIAEQFDAQQTEMIARHLIGQSSLVIAEQMELDQLDVESILAEAPQLIHFS